MKKIKRLAIIPAREGSVRIKNKNLKLFYNKPIIYYAIKSCLNSNLFSKIHVSSNSKKILNYSNKLGLKNDFIRPNYLSGGKVGLAPVIQFVVNQFEKLGKNYDQIWLIYATNPFINESIIKDCNKKFKKISKEPKNALMTVTKYNYPINWAQKINKKGFLEPIQKKKLGLRSQDLNLVFCDAGMINIYSGKKFLKKRKPAKYFPYEIPIYRSVDIDTKDDFEFAKTMFKIKI
jgi:N-acylneuraminate cytidylyltransferase